MNYALIALTAERIRPSFPFAVERLDYVVDIYEAKTDFIIYVGM